MIELINVSKSYVVQGKKKDILHNVSLTIHPGERIGIMGKNGAGKSTLLRLLCGVEKPSSGTIKITSRLSWPVGVSGGFLPNLTGRENIKFICRLFMDENDRAKERIHFVKEFAEIGDYFDMPVKTYSSGMRSRLAFSVSMAFDFDFYIIDEALAVGDAAFKQKCKDIFNQKAHQKGIIMVSHGIRTLKDFCDRGIFLNNKQMIKSDNINEIIQLYENLAVPA